MGELGSFIVNNWMLFLALLIIVVMLVMNGVRGKLVGFQEVKPVEAVRIINNQDVVLLDVREDNEFKQGHIINARHIPLSEVEARLSELEGCRDQSLLVYCRSGARAARAAATLKKNGFEKVIKLDGGVMAWTSANLPLEKG